MIAHALQIVASELVNHLTTVYGTANDEVMLGSPAEGLGNATENILRDRIVLSLVNIKEEKALKNLPNYVRDDVRMKASYQNPPVFVNLMVLVLATHNNYRSALSSISRVMRFFQHQNVFTHDSVAPGSINSTLINALDRMESFKLIFDLYSPSLEEVNHLWGIAGGKQFPAVMYHMRMLDLQYKAIQKESGLITKVESEFYHITETLS